MSFSGPQMLSAIVALIAAYFVYCNVMNRNGSRKAAFWWAFAVAFLPILFLPAYFIFRPKKAKS